MAAKAAANKRTWAKVGVWSYLIGLAIAVIVGLMQLWGDNTLSGWVVAVLAILGLIVGLLNISDDEVNTFLLAAIAFVVASSGMAAIFGMYGGATFKALQTFMSAIAIFTAPGALVVAFKALYNVAKDD